jgi:hypothetical protein
MIPIQQRGDGVTFSVRVHPKARHERIAGAMGDSLKVELTAPPVEGKANEACIRFFAELLKVPRASVTIAAGAGSRNKVIRISGVSATEVERAFAMALLS